MADLIDRKAAIDALGKRPGLAGECEWEIAARQQYDDDRAAIESVPSAQPELIRPKARDVYYEESEHCEFKCSLCHATIGVVEGGTLDGANFKYCPWCGAEMEGGDE